MRAAAIIEVDGRPMLIVGICREVRIDREFDLTRRASLGTDALYQRSMGDTVTIIISAAQWQRWAGQPINVDEPLPDAYEVRRLPSGELSRPDYDIYDTDDGP